MYPFCIWNNFKKYIREAIYSIMGLDHAAYHWLVKKVDVRKHYINTLWMNRTIGAKTNIEIACCNCNSMSISFYQSHGLFRFYFIKLVVKGEGVMS